MPEFYRCPFLGGLVEVTDERYAHVLDGHADLAVGRWERVAATLETPDLVIRSSQRNNGTVFAKWYDDLRKNILAVVISDANGRHWLVTAYMTRKTPNGTVLWAKN